MNSRQIHNLYSSPKVFNNQSWQYFQSLACSLDIDIPQSTCGTCPPSIRKTHIHLMPHRNQINVINPTMIA
jgi:hypothetical protein